MLNRAILMGRITADLELKQTPSGISVCAFSIAISRPKQKDKDQQTDFVDIVAWRQTAEFIAKYFAKGKMIIVEGSIQTRSYEDKNGNKRKAVEVIADNVQFGESKSSGGQSTTPSQAPQTAENTPAATNHSQSPESSDFSEMNEDSDNLPF